MELLCAEMKVQLLEKGLDEYRKESRMWEGLYRDTFRLYRDVLHAVVGRRSAWGDTPIRCLLVLTLKV